MGLQSPYLRNPRRSLEGSFDELSDSVFGVGGSKQPQFPKPSGDTHPQVKAHHPQVQFGSVPQQQKEQFERKKRQDIQRLNEEFVYVNNELTMLVEARNQQRDENDDLIEILREEGDRASADSERLKDALKKGTADFEYQKARWEAQGANYVRERDRAIEANEETRRLILESNTTLEDKQRRMIFEVAELEVQKKALLKYVDQTQGQMGRPDVSQIPQSDGQQLQQELRYDDEGNPFVEYVDQHGTVVCREANMVVASTPAEGF